MSGSNVSFVKRECARFALPDYDSNNNDDDGDGDEGEDGDAHLYYDDPLPAPLDNDGEAWQDHAAQQCSHVAIGVQMDERNKWPLFSTLTLARPNIWDTLLR